MTGGKATAAHPAGELEGGNSGSMRVFLSLIGQNQEVQLSPRRSHHQQPLQDMGYWGGPTHTPHQPGNKVSASNMLQAPTSQP